ncbi:unnamed protein product, partial [Symbiodinium sp. CCMP2592]
MAMTPPRVLLLLCTMRLCLAASCGADGQACDAEDQALLQHESNPRFNILQVSQTTVRKAKRCANEYSTKLASANISSEYRPWRYRSSMPASSRNMVIGAGMGTTGTHSVVVALEELGLKGYHFKDARASANEHAKEHELPDYVVPIVEQLKQNTTACRSAIETFDFSTLPENVEYVSDTPFTELFLDIYTQFPTAKVVLTTRHQNTACEQGKLDFAIALIRIRSLGVVVDSHLPRTRIARRQCQQQQQWQQNR